MNRISPLLIAAAGALVPWLAAAQVASTPAVPPPAAVQPGQPATPLPAARWTVAQVRESFDLADSDSNGELTRAEAVRLTIAPLSFEDMDRNKDGVLARAEYELAIFR
jgi:hypothetical protein